MCSRKIVYKFDWSTYDPDLSHSQIPFTAQEYLRLHRSSNYNIDSLSIPITILIDVVTPHQSHEDYQGLCLAHEAMIDISEYINEARRDCEMRQILTDVQVE